MEVFMNFINAMFGSILSLDPVSTVKMVVMWAIGGTLIYLAIKKDMEPSLLLPMGFGAILVNLPLSGAIDQMHELGIEVGALSELFRAGISNELFPSVSYTHLDVYKRQKASRSRPLWQTFMKKEFPRAVCQRPFHWPGFVWAGSPGQKRCWIKYPAIGITVPSAAV